MKPKNGKTQNCPPSSGNEKQPRENRPSLKGAIRPIPSTKYGNLECTQPAKMNQKVTLARKSKQKGTPCIAKNADKR